VIGGIKTLKDALTGLKEIENHQKMKKFGSRYFLRLFAIGLEVSRNQLNI
jgi:hypothetical protein